MMVSAVRAVVIGGGVLGVSTAHQLARQGAAVTLVSDAALAGGASGRSLAWLNSAAPRRAEYHQLRVLGIDRYRTLSARLPGLDWLRFDGGLHWGAEAEGMFAHQKAIGYAAEWVHPDEIPAVAPGVDPAAVPAGGAVFNPGEGWVDLPSLIDLLVKELTAFGGTVALDTGPATVTVQGDQVIGARTESGLVLDADVVVLATGAAVPDALARLGLQIGDRTPVSVLLRTQPVATGLRAVLNTPRVSLRPTPDGAIVLDSGWSEEAVERHADGTFDVPGSVVEGLLAEASSVLAGHPELPLESVLAGRKPIPADGEPVLGPVPGIAGLHAAFTHSGATLGLIAGELLADQIVTGEVHPLLATFGPGRFVA
jgi:glycine/D-amino acid oxidase-like deaminating enzyme